MISILTTTKEHNFILNVDEVMFLNFCISFDDAYNFFQVSQKVFHRVLEL